MSAIPLPPPHPLAKNDKNPVVFFDITITTPSTNTKTAPNRIIIELFPDIVSIQFIDYVRQFFLGTVTQNQQPFGLYRQLATRFIPNDSLAFSLIAEAANCPSSIISTAVSSNDQYQSKMQLSSSTTTSSSSSTTTLLPMYSIIVSESKLLPMYSIIVSESKLKLGHNFEFVIILSSQYQSKKDDLLIGSIIQGMDCFNYINNNVKSDHSTKEPLQPIQIVECGEL